MKQTFFDCNTGLIIGVSAVEKFELIIFIGSRMDGITEPFVSWEFSSREVKKVIADIEQLLSEELSEGLQEAYRQAIIGLQSPETLRMIKDFSYPDNIN